MLLLCKYTVNIYNWNIVNATHLIQSNKYTVLAHELFKFREGRCGYPS